MKDICVICGLNSSRSQVMEEFLKDKYRLNPKVKIHSAGLNVYKMREDDKRTLFTEEIAREASLIFVSDHDKFYKTRYNLLKNDEKEIKKVHLLRIPDVFYPHKNGFMPGQGNYEDYMKKIENSQEYQELVEFIKGLTLKEASALTEALYIKELYSTHSSKEIVPDKHYPFELLYKTLEFRFPQISKLIENIK